MELGEALRELCKQVEFLAMAIEQAEGIDVETQQAAELTRRGVEALVRRIRDEGITIGGENF